MCVGIWLYYFWLLGGKKRFLRIVFLCDKGEYHGNNPEMSKLLHKAVRQKNENAYAVYQQHLANRPVNVSAEDIFWSLPSRI